MNSLLKKLKIISMSKVFIYGTYGVMFFIGGFVLYYIKTKKEIEEQEKEKKRKQKIPDETLEKIMQKIKSHLVYNMAIYFDKTHDHDKHELSIEKEDGNDSSTELSNFSNQLLEKEKDTKLKFQLVKKGFQDLNKNPKKIAEELISIELQIIKSFGISHDEYFSSLKIALEGNVELRNSLQYLAKFKNAFENDELYPINFGRVIKEKFLKIVSNIYYLNLREVSRLLKYNYFEQGVVFQNEAEINKIIFHLYEKNLKRIRANVYKFFSVEDVDGLPCKLLVRVHAYYNSPHSKKRKEFEKLNDAFDTIRKSMVKGVFVREMVENENFDDVIVSPVDCVINFEPFVKQVTDEYTAPKSNDDILIELMENLKNNSQATKEINEACKNDPTIKDVTDQMIFDMEQKITK